MGMNADEESDEGTVPMKRPNKEDLASAEDVEGRTSPKGNGGESAAVRTPSRGSFRQIPPLRSRFQTFTRGNLTLSRGLLRVEANHRRGLVSSKGNQLAICKPGVSSFGITAVAKPQELYDGINSCGYANFLNTPPEIPFGPWQVELSPTVKPVSCDDQCSPARGCIETLRQFRPHIGAVLIKQRKCHKLSCLVMKNANDARVL
jgi:hypothetical protein